MRSRRTRLAPGSSDSSAEAALLSGRRPTLALREVGRSAERQRRRPHGSATAAAGPILTVAAEIDVREEAHRGGRTEGTNEEERS